MKNKRVLLVLNSALETEFIKDLVKEVMELEKNTTVDLLVECDGGEVSVAEFLSAVFRNAIADGRISSLNIVAVAVVSSAAIDFIYSLSSISQVYVGSALCSIFHKLSYDEKDTSEAVIAVQKMNIEKDLKITLEKYSKFLNRRQIAAYKKGADIPLTQDQITSIFNAKPIDEWK